MTQRAELLVIVAEFIEVRLAVRRSGDVDDAGALVVAVDVVPLDGGFDLVEVLQSEFFEHIEFVGKPSLAIGDAMSEAALHETAIAPAGC